MTLRQHTDRKGVAVRDREFLHTADHQSFRHVDRRSSFIGRASMRSFRCCT